MKRVKDPHHSYSIHMEQLSPHKQAINIVNSIEYTIGDILFQDNNINFLKDTMVHQAQCERHRRFYDGRWVTCIRLIESNDDFSTVSCLHEEPRPNATRIHQQ